MSVKKFLAILGFGITISICFVFYLKLQTRDTPKYLSTLNEALPPVVPRKVEIPNEVRQKYASVPDKPELIAAFEHEGRIETVSFSPVDSTLLVSRSKNDRITLWSLSYPNEPLAMLNGNSVSFSPDGKFLALSSLKHGTRLWNIKTKQNVNSFSSTGRDSIFSPNGKWLAIGTIGGIQLWDIRNPTQPAKGPKLRSKGLAEHLSFSSDGKLLTAADRVSGDVVIWEITGNSAEIKANFNMTSETVKRIEKLGFLPDAENPVLAIADNDKNIHLHSPTNWDAYSEIAAGYVNDFAFSSDAKILVSGGHNEIELWTIENGERILSIGGYSRWVNCIDISHDKNYVAGGANDGFLRVWEIDKEIFSQQEAMHSDVVKLIYFLPSDKAPRSDMPHKIDNLIKDVQVFFATEMERHGFGRKTFSIEDSAENSSKVYLLEGRTTEDYYFINTYKKIQNEVNQIFDSSNCIHFIVADISKVLSKKEERIVDASPRLTTSSYLSDVTGLIGGDIIMTVWDKGCSPILVSKYLGYTLGLDNDLHDPSNLMSYNNSQSKLSKSSAEWLDKSRYFNTNLTFFDSPATIEKISRQTGKLRFQIHDGNGIHQVRMIVKPTDPYPPVGYQLNTDPEKNKVAWERKHRGRIHVLFENLIMNAEEQTTVTFNFPEYAENQVKIQLIDMHGNIVFREIDLTDDRESSITTIVRRLFPE